MKIYIVSSGEYSDYGIDRIFLDKEKAEKYLELSQNGWNTTRLEEWETSDDTQFEEIIYVYVKYKKDSEYGNDGLKFEIRKSNTLDNTEENINHNYFWLSTYSGEKKLNIQRVINENYNKEQLEKKYTKVIHDLMAKIESLIQLEGWNEKMVQEWLEQNIDRYLG